MMLDEKLQEGNLCICEMYGGSIPFMALKTWCNAWSLALGGQRSRVKIICSDLAGCLNF
jgi:hypothetical protein